MNATPVIIEKTLNAPVAKVWQAISDNSLMKKWYFQIADFQPVVGFEFSFLGENEGRSFNHLCKVTRVESEKVLAYSWQYEGQPGYSEVTFELFPEGDKTRLKLTHTGIETFPATPDYAKANFNMGWTELAGMLGEFVETT